MRFPQPLARGRLLARYKRFFADLLLDEHGPVTAHVANPGRMLGLLDDGAVCWASPAASPGRKLAWSLELIETHDGALVGVNTQHANRIAAEAIIDGRIPELAGYTDLKREVSYGASSRIDLLLEAPRRPRCWVEVKTEPPHLQQPERCWIEVKSVTLSRVPGLVEWPDCVSSRSTRQLTELQQVVADGDRAVLLFLVQRSDCRRFGPAEDLDPAFSNALRVARLNGVEVLAYDTSVATAAIKFRQALKIEGCS